VPHLALRAHVRRRKIAYSLEFFFWPCSFEGIDIFKNVPTEVVTILCVYDMDKKEMLEKEGFTVKDYDPKWWEFRFTIMWIGSIFTQFFVDIIRDHMHHHHPSMTWFFPFVVSLSGIMAFPIDKKNPVGYIVPQFRANHPVNAAGCVEKIRCVLMEWTTPIANIADAESWKLTRDVYRLILTSMCETFSQFSETNPYKALPTSIAAELRVMSVCETPLISPTCERPGIKYMGAPEMVGHSIGNKYWSTFLHEIDDEIRKRFAAKDQALLVHLAKQGFEFENYLEYSNNEYDKIKPDGKNSALKLFNAERKKADPAGVFLTPFFAQWLGGAVPTYKPPKGTHIDTAGDYK